VITLSLSNQYVDYILHSWVYVPCYLQNHLLWVWLKTLLQFHAQYTCFLTAEDSIYTCFWLFEEHNRYSPQLNPTENLIQIDQIQLNKGQDASDLQQRDLSFRSEWTKLFGASDATKQAALQRGGRQQQPPEKRGSNNRRRNTGARGEMEFEFVG